MGVITHRMKVHLLHDMSHDRLLDVKSRCDAQIQWINEAKGCILESLGWCISYTPNHRFVADKLDLECGLRRIGRLQVEGARIVGKVQQILGSSSHCTRFHQSDDMTVYS